MRLRHVLPALAMALLSACSSRPDYVPRYFAPIGEGDLVRIPFDPPDSDIQLVGRVCRPDQGGKSPVVVIAHGSPSDPSRIKEMQPTGCDSEPARWFNDRGFIVVFALRRGFGGSTGPVMESIGPCARATYFRAGLQGARDIDATVKFAAQLPYAQPNNVIVVGQSVGGWAAIAYNSVIHPQVAAMISFAGGTGGYAYGVPNEICNPGQFLVDSRRFGQTAKGQMLWVYAQNDSFFGPDYVRQLYTTYTRTGARVALAQVPPFGSDGHGLFYAPGGSQVWGPIVEGYLASIARGQALR